MVRFLYEIYFEICLCLLINLSYYGEPSSATSWWFSLFLAIVTIATLLLVLSLVWNGGPALAGTYEKMPLRQAIWRMEIKPITQGIQDMLASVKEKEARLKSEREHDNHIKIEQNCQAFGGDSDLEKQQEHFAGLDESEHKNYAKA